LGSRVPAKGGAMTPEPDAPVLEPIGPSTRERFLARLRAEMAAEGLDALLLLDMHDVVWLTGFVHSPSERPIGVHVPIDGEIALFVPLLEREHAEEGWVRAVECYEEFPGEVPAAVWMLQRIRRRQPGVRRVGVDALDASLLDAARAEVSDLRLSRAAERVRAVKEPEELALIRAAARHADRCLEAILEAGPDVWAAGGSEIDLLEAGLVAARALQAEELGDRFAPFKVAVVGTAHSGPRAALPHGRTSARRPLPGDVLIAGIGAAVGGYHAESGATFVLGEPSADQRRCLTAAQACNDAAIAALVPGARCAAVNQAGLAELRAAGLGDAIRHRVGHGMGIQGHEAPWLAPGDGTLVAAGMVFSNEPGIYRPGLDGYRTINSMIVTEAGVEVPSTFQARVPWERRVLAAR
jgi:Xaa-Pro dipeptidase